MENVLRDKDIWILGSVCVVATFLWGRLWKLFSAKRKGRTAASAGVQVTKHDEGGPCATREQQNVGKRQTFIDSK